MHHARFYCKRNGWTEKVAGLMTGAGGLYAAERLEALKRTAAGYSRKSKPYQASHCIPGLA